MANEKIFNTRIKLRIDTLENWNKSSAVLLPGEIAFASVAASEGTGLTEPVIMAKIATEEGKTFSELPWAFHAKASDVLTACKSEASLRTFINGVIADAGIATDEALTTLAGRVTTAEGKITTLEGTVGDSTKGLVKGVADNAAAIDALETLVGDTAVATQIANAIAELKLGETYAAKSLETTVDNHIKDTVAHVTADDKVKWNNALQSTDVATGSANGTISVKGNDVAIKGLGSAAYTESTAYDASGAAATAEANAKAYAKEYADGLAGNYDAKGAAATAESNAKAYAKEYADGLAGNYDAAGSAADALEEAKGYTDAEIEEWVGTETVAAQIATAITNQDLANKYDAKGAAAAVEGKLNTHISEAAAAYETKTDAAQKLVDAKDYTDTEVAKVQGEVDALEQYVGVIPEGYTEETVVAYIDKKAAETLAAASGNSTETAASVKAALDEYKEDNDERVKAAEDAIDAIEADYLKGADKTELQGSINTLSELVGDKKVSEQITDVTNPLDARVKAIEDDYLTSEDKTELTNAIATAKQEAIATVLGEGVDEDFDTLKEVAEWILSDTTGAAALQKDVADIKADYLKAADKTELEGKITAAQNAADKAQGEVDDLEGVVATKAAQADLEALAGRVTTVEGDLNTETTGLKARMTAAEADIDALEAKVGDETVAAQIEAALEVAKTDAANKDAVVLAEAQRGLEAHTGNADVHVTAEQKTTWSAAVQTVTAAADSGLKAVKTGNDVAIELDDSIVWVFDCGTSAV